MMVEGFQRSPSITTDSLSSHPGQSPGNQGLPLLLLQAQWILEVHESPSISPASDDECPPGMDLGYVPDDLARA